MNTHDRGRIYEVGHRPAPSSDARRETVDEMREQAVWLHAFDPAGFGTPTGSTFDADRNQIAAGALMQAGNTVLSSLFEDTARLLTEQESVAADPDRMIILGKLPGAFAHVYNFAFAERFVIVTANTVGALHQPKWISPCTIAERLALHVLITVARSYLITTAITDWSGSHEVYEPFRAAVSPDRDYELRYEVLYELDRDDLPPELRDADDPLDEFGGLIDRRTLSALAHWFQPVDGRGFIHPFLRDW